MQRQTAQDRTFPGWDVHRAFPGQDRTDTETDSTGQDLHRTLPGHCEDIDTETQRQAAQDKALPGWDIHSTFPGQILRTGEPRTGQTQKQTGQDRTFTGHSRDRTFP